jgi:hypothetical protein
MKHLKTQQDNYKKELNKQEEFYN